MDRKEVLETLKRLDPAERVKGFVYSTDKFFRHAEINTEDRLCVYATLITNLFKEEKFSSEQVKESLRMIDIACKNYWNHMEEENGNWKHEKNSKESSLKKEAERMDKIEKAVDSITNCLSHNKIEESEAFAAFMDLMAIFYCYKRRVGFDEFKEIMYAKIERYRKLWDKLNATKTPYE